MSGPRTPGKAPKRPAVFVRLPEGDYWAVAGLAKRAGLSMEAYVRSLVAQRLEGTEAA